MESPNPQKRHAALVPLSHDHHHGLVAAVRLKSGRAAYNTVPDIPASIVRLMETELEPHFVQEEEELFAADYPDEIASMVERLRAEHQQLRALAATCRAGTCDGASGRAFGELLALHIRYEERVFFPAIQELLEAEVLERIGMRIAARDRSRDACS